MEKINLKLSHIMIIQTIVSTLSAIKKNKISKLVVRELDEESAGTFVAFVEDGSDTFDVAITVIKDEVTHHTCDCLQKTAFCEHQIAVLLQITNSVPAAKPKAVRAKKPAKLTEAQQLLQDLSLHEITKWLHEYLAINKEAEMQFLLKFSKKTVSYNSNDIDKVLTTAFTSVIGKRKKIELNELKKIIQYLDQGLEPIFTFLQTIIYQPKAYALLEHMENSLRERFYKNTVPGTRLQKYQVQLIEKFTFLLNTIKDVALWQKQMDFLLQKLFDMDFERHDTTLINTIFYSYKNGNDQQKEHIASKIVTGLLGFTKEQYSFSIEINKILLEIVIDSKQLKNSYSYFHIYPYENAFNLLFLNALMSIDSETTIVLCYECMYQNSKPDYNLPYLKIIENLLEHDSNRKNELATIKHDLFQLAPNFERYQFVLEHFDDADYVLKFKKRTLQRLESLFYSEDEHRALYLQILHSEGKYAKMIEVFSHNSVPYKIVAPYLETLAAMNKRVVLLSLMRGFVHCMVKNIPLEDTDSVRAFTNTYFTPQENRLLLVELWDKHFRYYPERLRDTLFELLS